MSLLNVEIKSHSSAKRLNKRNKNKLVKINIPELITANFVKFYEIICKNQSKNVENTKFVVFNLRYCLKRRKLLNSKISRLQLKKNDCFLNINCSVEWRIYSF